VVQCVFAVVRCESLGFDSRVRRIALGVYLFGAIGFRCRVTILMVIASAGIYLAFVR
jgi:hypothetical protein